MEKSIAQGMFASAGEVLATLVDRSVDVGLVTEDTLDASFRVEDATVATVTAIPAANISFVTLYQRSDLAHVVEMMLGTSSDGGSMDAMQLSIVAETVAQISSAMAERLAVKLGVPSEGIHTEVATEAGAFPPPPFVTAETLLDIGSEFGARVTLAFDGVAQNRIEAKPSAPAPAPTRPAAPVPQAQAISFTAMSPTPIRAAAPGQANLDLVHDIPLLISAVLGKTALSLRDVVALQSGSVFQLDKLSTDPIDLFVNNILIARGEVVVVDDKFAVKISELNPAVDKV
jgi:flagellar motor switch protein FliN